MQYFYRNYNVLSLFVKSKWNLLHLLVIFVLYETLVSGNRVTIIYFSILDYDG